MDAAPRVYVRRSTIWRLARILASTFVLLLVIAAVLWTRCGIRGCPDIGHLDDDSPNGATIIKDRSGLEIARMPPLLRVRIQLDSLPGYVPAAFVAMEDRRFWRHHGIDWRRVAGAAYHNLRSFGIEQGSSTITMQLARNAFPDRLPASQRTMSRKLAEARVALMIEQKYSKRQILEMYLNQIYFGHGAYGIEAAARQYFGKHAAQLTLGEAALLAGLPRAPTLLNPRSNLEQARKGRRAVLKRMVAQHQITAAQAAVAAATPITLRRVAPAVDGNAPYFVQAVRQLLEDSLSEAVDTYGYTIETTLDSKLQTIAEDEVNRQLATIESGAYGTFDHPTYMASGDSGVSKTGTGYLQAAVVFMDPRTGDVRALIGGRDYHDSQYNRALNADRQMASTFKPFVYAAAVAAGYPPTFQLSDEPLHMMVGGKEWSPENDDGKYHDVVTMRQALAASSNVATVRLATMLGMGPIVQEALHAGLHGPIPTVPATVLGSLEATPLDVTTAYATLATLGTQPQPRLVTRVLDAKGRVVWQQKPVKRVGLDPAVAFVVTDMLKDAIDSGGTAASLRETGYRGLVAGKTGTSNGAADLWFVGYTPEVVGTIWVGFDQPRPIVPDGESGTMIAPIWGRIMVRYGDPGPEWATPPGVVARHVDGTGRAYESRCAPASSRVEYFLARAAPAASC